MNSAGDLKVLIVGSGGREHALAWKVRQSPRVSRLYVAPGNAGTAALGENIDIAADDIEGLLSFAQSEQIDLTIVGPEIPLIRGIADRFRAVGLRVFGPSAAAARIEGSKAWAKGLMERHGIPTGQARRFSDTQAALDYVRSLDEESYVLKADGPAAGKGVILPASHLEAEAVIRGMIEEGVFGASGATLLVEERMTGPEVSVFAFIQGAFVSPEIAACDYKRAFDNDEGPNTGGVGAYSPPELWTDALASEVRTRILAPTAAALVEEGCPYTGMLYAGLMLTPTGPRVIEFNCRFGDPETQGILPLFDGDLASVCLDAAEGRLDQSTVKWRNGCTAVVVVTSDGYPGQYKTGMQIDGLAEAERSALVFHAGTTLTGRSVTVSGGRVLACVGEGAQMQTARSRAYESAGQIKFEGAYFRKDIAERAIVSSG